MSEAQRVQKLLAAAGVGSRRACEQLIAEGRVTVDGHRVRLGDRARGDQRIAVDGERVQTDTSRVYLLLNKPYGFVTTAHDPQGRPTVMDLVPAEPRVFPVGRLDLDTEGLLLLTNDGDLANRLLHPRYGVRKTYVAKVRGTVTRRALRQLTDGIELDDGPAVAVSARILAEAGDERLVEVVVAEGRRREVRRMMGAVKLHVERLARVQFGSLGLGEISPGKVRPLTGQEVRALYRDVDLAAADAEGTPGAGAGADDGAVAGAGRTVAPTPDNR